MKEALLEVNGKVVELLAGTEFKVQLENGKIILAYISGKIRINNIRIILGDTVKLQISPYNLKWGRIIYRYR